MGQIYGGVRTVETKVIVYELMAGDGGTFSHAHSYGLFTTRDKALERWNKLKKEYGHMYGSVEERTVR